MREAGIQVGDKDSLDIRYEGASDDEGISETQTSEVVVYRVSKEKVESTELPKEEVIDEKGEDLSTNLKSELSEIKELKEQLKSIGSDVEREELISKISEKLSNLEKKVDTVEDDFSKELLEIEKNIKDAEKVLKEDLEKQEDIQKNLTEKFIRTFRRIEYHFSNINIVSYPFEIDDNMYIVNNNNYSSNNELLDEMYRGDSFEKSPFRRTDSGAAGQYRAGCLCGFGY